MQQFTTDKLAASNVLSLEDISKIPAPDPKFFRSQDASTHIHSLLDSEHVLWVKSGRSAIYLTLRHLNIGKGDYVLVPSYHCPTMVAPIVELGAKPLFYPIHADGTACIEHLTSLAPDHIRAILAVHFFGTPRHMRALREWSNQRGLALIEDCAHTMFGSVDGKPVGTWGDFAIGSLTKFLPVTEGGLLVSQSEELSTLPLSDRALKNEIKSFADMLELMSLRPNAGLLSLPIKVLFKIKKRIRGNRASTLSCPASDDEINRPREAWDGFSLDVQQATSKLARTTRWVCSHINLNETARQRRNNAQLLINKLKNTSGAHALSSTIADDEVPYVVPFWVDNPEPVYRQLKAMRFPVYRWDRLWPDVPHLPNDQGLLWSRHVFQLVCHQSQTEQDIQRMADAFRQACQQN